MFHVYTIVFLLLYTLEYAYHQKLILCQPPYSDSSLPLAPSPSVTTTLSSVSTWFGLFFISYLFCFLY